MANTDMKILTWNYNGIRSSFKDNILIEMLSEHAIDILVLQESYDLVLEKKLTGYKEVSYNAVNNPNGVRIFLKNKKFDQRGGNKLYGNKLVLLSLSIKGKNEWFNLFAVHLYSKVGRSDRAQMWKNLPLVKAITKYEKLSSAAQRSILIGDLNNNPFDLNLLDPNLLNTRESRELIPLHQNIIEKQMKDDFWYNPMWNFLGDYDYINDDVRLTGTYYLSKFNDQPNWHLFDGVLLRPTLMNNINFSESKIITKTKTNNFIKSILVRMNETLIHEDFSDHLPFLFTLKN